MVMKRSAKMKGRWQPSTLTIETWMNANHQAREDDTAEDSWGFMSFTETKEIVAGYWLWEVKDMDEAVAWVKRCPNPMPGPSEIEIRPFYEMEDFGEALTPAAAEIHDRVRDKLESN